MTIAEFTTILQSCACPVLRSHCPLRELQFHLFNFFDATKTTVSPHKIPSDTYQ